MFGWNARWVLGLSVVCGLAVVSCEDKSDEPSFVPDSVPPEKPLDELDPVEQEAFCDEAIEWAGDLIENGVPQLLCRADGLQAGGTAAGFDVAACRAAEKACLAEPPEDEDELDSDNLQCNFEGLGEACDSTVADYASCFEESATLLERALAQTTCEKIGAGNIPDEADFQVSARCEAILESCSGDDTQVESTSDSVGPTATGGDTDPGESESMGDTDTDGAPPE